MQFYIDNGKPQIEMDREQQINTKEYNSMNMLINYNGIGENVGKNVKGQAAAKRIAIWCRYFIAD